MQAIDENVKIWNAALNPDKRTEADYDSQLPSSSYSVLINGVQGQRWSCPLSVRYRFEKIVIDSPKCFLRLALKRCIYGRFWIVENKWVSACDNSSPTGGAKNREIFNSEATVWEDCHFICELSISLFLLYHVVLRLSRFFRTIFAFYVLRIFETAILSVGLYWPLSGIGKVYKIPDFHL